MRAFKGEPPSVVRVFSENSTARFWLNLGKKYLIFVTQGDFDKPVGESLTIDTCGNSSTLREPSALLRQLQTSLAGADH